MRELADAVEPLTDLPFGLFGHSMGARVAFELTRELQPRRTARRSILFGVGSGGRTCRQGSRDLHPLDDAELIEEVPPPWAVRPMSFSTIPK